MKRLHDAYNNMLDQSQYGFRSNTGCDDAIFIVRNIIVKSSETMYLVFIDLTAAYNKIPRHLLFRVMDIRLGCKHLVSLIQSIYTETTAKIRGSKKWFKVTNGCRQLKVGIKYLTSQATGNKDMNIRYMDGHALRKCCMQMTWLCFSK